MLNKSNKWILAIISVGFLAVFVIYQTEFSNSCSVRQLGIASDLKKYDATKDPQFCDTLNTKIFKFNDECKSDVEEVDCG